MEEEIVDVVEELEEVVVRTCLLSRGGMGS